MTKSEKLRIVARNQWADPESRAKKLRGMRASFTPERRRKHSIAATGKPCAQATREKLRLLANAQWANIEAREKVGTRIRSWAASPEGQKVLREKAHRLWADPVWRAKRERAHREACQRPEFREHARQSRLSQKLPRENTYIEQRLAGALKEAGLEFEMHKTMFGRSQPDFVFPVVRVIVQADGDYWHSLPSYVERDTRFNTIAAQEGWLVLRFKGTKISQELSTCLDAIVEAVHAQSSIS